MSVDWFLYSPSHNKDVMVGSIGFSGTQAFPAHPDVIAFLTWVIEERVTDVVLVPEERLYSLQEEREDSRETT